MKPNEFREAIWLKNRTENIIRENNAYRERHPEFKRLEFNNEFYFRILHDRQAIHWALIVMEKKCSIYFVDIMGQAFDKLEFRTLDYAIKQLEKNYFLSSLQFECPYQPIKPIFVDLRYGRKSAPYSRGNLWSK